MPEILEQRAQAVGAAGRMGLRRTLLGVVGSAGAVTFPVRLHLRSFPQLPLVWKKTKTKPQRCQERQPITAGLKLRALYLRLLPPGPEAHLGVPVETI